MEFWDAYTRDGVKIPDQYLVRGREIPDGMYHKVVEIIVWHAEDLFLLMQRAPEKHLGLKWELSAGGSVLKGEAVPMAAVRETLEETGISLDRILHIGTKIRDDHQSIYDIFLGFTNCPLDSVSLQEGETVDYRWVSVEELNAMDKSLLASERSYEVLCNLSSEMELDEL